MMRLSYIKIDYDQQADCGYIYLTGGEDRRRILMKGTKEIQIAPEGVFGRLVIDIDHNNRIVGIEVLGVAAIMPQLPNLVLDK